MAKATSDYLEANPTVAAAAARVGTANAAAQVAAASDQPLLAMKGLEGRTFDIEDVGSLLGSNVHARGSASILEANAGAFSLQIKVQGISILAKVRQVDAGRAVLELKGPGGVGGQFIGDFTPGTATAASMHPAGAHFPLEIKLVGKDPKTSDLALSMEFGGREAVLKLSAR